MTRSQPESSRKRQSGQHTNFRSARDFEARASQVGDPEPISDETKFRTQWIIAGNAQGPDHEAQVADATLLMRILGVHPDDQWAGNVLPIAPRYNNTAPRKGGSTRKTPARKNIPTKTKKAKSTTS